TSQLMEDLYGCPLSPGSVVNIVRTAAEGARALTEQIKPLLMQEPWSGFDETGLSVKGKSHWLHSASTPPWTLWHVDERRGGEGSGAGAILPKIRGPAIHDYLPPYLNLNIASMDFATAITSVTCALCTKFWGRVGLKK